MTTGKIHKDKKQEEVEEKITERYTIFGRHDNEIKSKDDYPLVLDVEEDTPNTFAKKVTIGDSIQYFIRRDDNQKIVNPIGFYSETRTRKPRYDKIKPFVKVNKMVFGLYLRFLQTKNIAYFHQAERLV